MKNLKIEKNEDCGDGVMWVSVSGTDSGTGWEFDGVEVFGVTECGRVLDCDGSPITVGDRLEIAVRRAVTKV